MRNIKKAYIEITNACNLSCTFCPGTRRPKAFMAAGDFKNALGRLAGRVQCLYFHVMGEPLLHRELGLFLDMAHEADLPVNLTTNGTLLGEVRDMLVKKQALRQVNISLHSQAEREDVDYLENVLAFARMARGEGNVLIGLRLWNQRGGGAPENEWIIGRLAEEFGLQRASLIAAWDGRGIRLEDGIYLNRSELFEWPSLSLPEPSKAGFCMGLRDQIGILCDGTVVPCCLDGEGIMVLGNLFRQPLEEILASPRAVAIYEGFSRREAVEELCGKCGYRRRFERG